MFISFDIWEFSLTVMMEESKLTNFQRRQLQENMKSKLYMLLFYLSFCNYSLFLGPFLEYILIELSFSCLSAV